MVGVHLKNQEMEKSKYYYDYTRNMSEDQISRSYCKKPYCIDIDDCDCIMIDKFEWEQTTTADDNYLNYYDSEQA